jgi:damage-control phosphatase, subfamily I
MTLNLTLSTESLTGAEYMTQKPLTFIYDCIPCAIGSLLKLFKQGFVPSEKQDEAMRCLLKYLSKVEFNQSPPALGREMHRQIRQVLNNPDPYKEIKNKSNSLMLAYYPTLKAKVDNAPDPFNFALRTAIAGNVIDFGPNNSFDINETLKKAESVKLAVDHSQQLKSDLLSASTLLYLGDNAGEIVMDRLFLETINHPNVCFAVRSAPIINDITKNDAFQVGIDKTTTIIANGDDAPGTILENTSPEFRDVFNSADLIIAKGQGNYESLCGCSKSLYFILMAKCDHVANHLGVQVGDFLVMKN